MNTLIAKLAKASQKVGALATDKVNASQNYAYISADKILQRAGDALAELGVVVVPSILNETTQETNYTDNYGKAKTRYDAVVNFEMFVSDGEGELKAGWVGRGSDFAVPDKALYKAITSGHKYYLAKLLNIGVGNEDGEHEDTQAPQEAAATTQKPQAARSTKPATTTQSPPHNRLWGQGQSAFGADWDTARPWLIEKWTGKTSSDNVRSSASDLSDTEKDLLADYIKGNIAALQGIWAKQKVAA